MCSSSGRGPRSRSISMSMEAMMVECAVEDKLRRIARRVVAQWRSPARGKLNNDRRATGPVWFEKIRGASTYASISCNRQLRGHKLERRRADRKLHWSQTEADMKSTSTPPGGSVGGAPPKPSSILYMPFISFIRLSLSLQSRQLTSSPTTSYHALLELADNTSLI